MWKHWSGRVAVTPHWLRTIQVPVGGIGVGGVPADQGHHVPAPARVGVGDDGPLVVVDPQRRLRLAVPEGVETVGGAEIGEEREAHRLVVQERGLDVGDGLLLGDAGVRHRQGLVLEDQAGVLGLHPHPARRHGALQLVPGHVPVGVGPLGVGPGHQDAGARIGLTLAVVVVPVAEFGEAAAVAGGGGRVVGLEVLHRKPVHNVELAVQGHLGQGGGGPHPAAAAVALVAQQVVGHALD